MGLFSRASIKASFSVMKVLPPDVLGEKLTLTPFSFPLIRIENEMA
jgi:hypothetical protein